MTIAIDTETLRQEIIEICRAMNARGLNHGSAGNVSVRVADGVLITPSGVDYDAMTPDSIVKLPTQGAPKTGTRPSSEWRFHQALLAARPDMSAVVHAHPPYCTALAVQRRAIPACHYMVAAFGGADIPLAGYDIYGSAALADEVTRVMADRHGCLMANHGATVLGESLDRALWRLEELEALSRTYLLSQIGGRPVLLTEGDIAAVAVSIADYGRR